MISMANFSFSVLTLIWFSGIIHCQEPEYAPFLDENTGLFGYSRAATGQIIIKPVYDDAADFSEGMAAVCKNQRWGFINESGTVVVPLIYARVDNFYDGVAIAKDYDIGKYGFIDKNNKVVIPFKFSEITDFDNGIANAAIDDKIHGKIFGLIDRSGKIIEEGKYKRMIVFTEDLAEVCLPDSRWGYIDRSGMPVSSFEYQSAMPFS